MSTNNGCSTGAGVIPNKIVEYGFPQSVCRNGIVAA